MVKVEMVGSRWYGRMMLLLFLSTGVWGCSTVTPTSQGTRSSQEGEGFANIQVQDLAGVWEYAEGNAVQPLTFDQEGNGTYEWKQGRFTTTSLEKGLWKGTWHQQENDREGGFEIQLAQDLRTATGRWWYTRIEQDRAPLNPGGAFRLTKLSGNVKEN